MVRRHLVVAAFGLALVAAGCTSGGSDAGPAPSTTAAPRSTTTTAALSEREEAAQRWLQLREDNDCEGQLFGEAQAEVTGVGLSADPGSELYADDDWPQVQRQIQPVARRYAAIKEAMIDAVEASDWPADAQEAIKEQMLVQRARVSWIRRIGEATSMDEFRAAIDAPLPSDRSGPVRYELGIPATGEVHTSEFCADR